MLNRIWHLIGVAALVVGGVLAILDGPDGDAYSVLAFLVVVMGVASLTRRAGELTNEKACGKATALPQGPLLTPIKVQEETSLTEYARLLPRPPGACSNRGRDG